MPSVPVTSFSPSTCENLNAHEIKCERFFPETLRNHVKKVIPKGDWHALEYENGKGGRIWADLVMTEM